MAELVEQLHIEVEDKVGKLAELTDAMTGAGVNIKAAVAWVEGSTGHMMMVTDDNQKACQTISAAVSKCQPSQAVCATVPNEIGALGKIARVLADAGVSICILYASAAGKESLVVMETTDNDKAAGLL